MTIEMVIESHFHADFLSGHLELAAATGGTIAYGSVAETEFESRKLSDGEKIVLGDVVLEIRHTPGYTPESISVVVYEHLENTVPYACGCRKLGREPLTRYFASCGGVRAGPGDVCTWGLCRPVGA
jgi:hypothetical protein